MNPWTEILDQIWYYLEQGPNSSAVTSAFPPANRYKYGADQLDAIPPENVSQSVLIVDQMGGRLDMNYSPQFLLATEKFQITVWTATLELAAVNALRLAIVAAMEPGLPDLALSSVLETKFSTGIMTLTPDKIEQDADGRLLQWRNDLRKARQRAVLLQLDVTFLIDRTTLTG